jgi:TetR/AcrR family transcriptional regulator, lmrAB and yxaGH operons repressor
MARQSDSKAKTIAAAAQLFRQQGYHGTALHDILGAGGSPRGSLYFHFPKGKEEIGEAALGFVAERVREGIARAAEASDSAESFLVRVASHMGAELEQSGFKEGCPVAGVAVDAAAQSAVLGAAAGAAFQLWEREIGLGLERFGMAAGKAERVATMVLSQLEGALLLSRTYRSLEPIHRAGEALRLLASL